jgi:hypothetical protein
VGGCADIVVSVFLLFRIVGAYPGYPVLGKREIMLDQRKTFASDQKDLLSREWFGRAWTFQELVLAVNPIILCGYMEISWTDFVSGLEIELGRHSFLTSPLHAVGIVWMNIPRPTQWNGKTMRQMLVHCNDERPSFRTYFNTIRGRPSCPNTPGICHTSVPIVALRWMIGSFEILVFSVVPWYSINFELAKFPKEPSVVASVLMFYPYVRI